MSQLIRDWEELSKIQKESSTHILTVSTKNCNGHLYAKEAKPYDANKDFLEQAKHLDHYLTTHTFYESQYQKSTKLLQACGFDVVLESWG